jgi:hypothetical protein
MHKREEEGALVPRAGDDDSVRSDGEGAYVLRMAYKGKIGLRAGGRKGVDVDDRVLATGDRVTCRSRSVRDRAAVLAHAP